MKPPGTHSVKVDSCAPTPFTAEVKKSGTRTTCNLEARETSGLCYHGDWDLNRYAYLMCDLLLLPCVGGNSLPLSLSCLDIIRIEGVQVISLIGNFCIVMHTSVTSATIMKGNEIVQ